MDSATLCSVRPPPSMACSSSSSSMSCLQPVPSLLPLFAAPLSTSSRKAMLRFRIDGQLRRRSHVVRMAPEEEKMTRRSPLDFPIEWERPKPGRRPDIFPQFSPMKTPLPPPLPADPPEEDEEEEEKKEEEEDPEKEGDPEMPESNRLG